MSTVYIKSMACHTHGELPAVGQSAPDFNATATDLSPVQLTDFNQQALLINVYPSIDTQVCFQSVKRFQQALATRSDVAIICMSMDLPFALSRIQAGEQLQGLHLLSDFRNREFGDVYGLTIADGPLAGLLARAVIVLNQAHEVVYTQLVQDISQPPDYEQALAALAQN